MAQDARELCADRPGANDAPCTLEAGQAQVETGLSWTRSGDGAARVDDYAIGETLVRFGLDGQTELRLGWTALGISDPRGGPRSEGVGDVTIGVRRNLASPDGSGFSVAAQAYATIPVGTGPLETGDWSAGFALPLSVELSDRLSFGATPRIAAEVDADGDGRHVAIGASAGFDLMLTGNLEATADLAVTQDDDPAGSTTELLADLSFGWKVDPDVQLDVGLGVGLNDDSPDFTLAAGIIIRF